MPSPSRIKRKKRQEDLNKVGTLIQQGFLTVCGELFGHRFIWKTVNASERSRARLLSYNNTRPEEPVLCALSVFTIDGFNFLPGREDILPSLIEVFSNFPIATLSDITRSLIRFNSMTNDLLPLVEAYSYTPASLILWRGIGKSLVNNPSITGIPGTDIVGLNDFQLSWAGYMKVEDMRSMDHMIRNTGKLVASTMSPKGIKDLDREETSREKEEEKRRQFLITGVRTSQEGYEMDVATETSELEEQWKKEQAGELDDHDLAVQDHETRVKQLLEDRKAELSSIRSSVDMNVMPDLAIDIGGGSFAMTPEAMAEYKQRLIDIRDAKIRSTAVDPTAILRASRTRKK